MGKSPPRPQSAEVGDLPIAGCRVRCAGCKIVLTVLPELTEFMCPTCQLPQTLPPELIARRVGNWKLRNVPAEGIDPTKIQLECACCKAILNVPHTVSRFNCPQCLITNAVVSPKSTTRKVLPPQHVNQRGSRVNEDSDISDSEMDVYKEVAYKLLKFRTHKVKGPNGTYRCPFCTGNEEQYNQYTRLLQHATRVAHEGSTQSAKQRANHFAMAMYLATDLPDEAEPPPQKSKKLKRMAEGILEKQETLSLELERKQQELDSQSKELDKREGALSERERQNSLMNINLERERRELDSRRQELDKCEAARIERDSQKLKEEEVVKLELERKRLQLDRRSHKLDLREKSIELERQDLPWENTKNDISRLVRTLKKEVMKRRGNAELQTVQLKLIKLLSDVWIHGCVNNGIRRMGNIVKAFNTTCKKRFRTGEAEIKALQLCIYWEEILRISCRQFEIIVDGKGNPQGLLRKNDFQVTNDDWQLRGALQDLKEEWGEEIYSLIIASLTDVHKYHSRGV